MLSTVSGGAAGRPPSTGSVSAAATGCAEDSFTVVVAQPASNKEASAAHHARGPREFAMWRVFNRQAARIAIVASL
jgi:hypothetical protein